MAVTDIVKRTSHHVLDEAKDMVIHPTKRPYRTSSIFALVLLGAGLYWMLPEIRRYIRIERM